MPAPFPFSKVTEAVGNSFDWVIRMLDTATSSEAALPLLDFSEIGWAAHAASVPESPIPAAARINQPRANQQ